MGDVALSVPVVHALSEQHPEIEVYVLTQPKFFPIFSGIPRVKLIALETRGAHRGFWGIRSLAQTLKQHRWMSVIDAHNVLRTRLLRFWMGDVAPWFVLDKGRADKRALMRKRGKIFRPLSHATDRYADLCVQAGFPIALGREACLPKPNRPEDMEEDMEGKDTGFWMGVAPFAAHQTKQYPWSALIDALTAIQEQSPQRRIRLVFFGGGAKELMMIEELMEGFPSSIHTLDLPLETQLAWAAHLDVMLAMDSANGHLAAMYGVPVVTLWGQTHPYAGFAPFLQPMERQIVPDRAQYPLLPTTIFGKKGYKPYARVMESIAPERVAEVVINTLNSPG
ncbi:MAG: hypothetical protein RLZZ463_1224 [Bacteroidota bacterium]